MSGFRFRKGKSRVANKSARLVNRGNVTRYAFQIMSATVLPAGMNGSTCSV